MPVIANKFVVVGKETAAPEVAVSSPQAKNLQEIRQIVLERDNRNDYDPKKISQYVLDMYNTADGLISFDK